MSQIGRHKRMPIPQNVISQGDICDAKRTGVRGDRCENVNKENRRTANFCEEEDEFRERKRLVFLTPFLANFHVIFGGFSTSCSAAFPGQNYAVLRPQKRQQKCDNRTLATSLVINHSSQTPSPKFNQVP